MQSIKQINYDSYLKADLDSYIGEWVVICEGRVVSHNKNLKKAVAEAKKKYGEKRFMIAKVPSKETMIY